MSGPLSHAASSLNLCLAVLLILGVRKVADVVADLAHMPVARKPGVRGRVWPNPAAPAATGSRAMACSASSPSARFVSFGFPRLALALSFLSCMGWPLQVLVGGRPPIGMPLSHAFLPGMYAWPISVCVLLALTGRVKVESHEGADDREPAVTTEFFSFGVLVFLLLQSGTPSATAGEFLARATQIHGPPFDAAILWGTMSRWGALVAPLGFLLALLFGAFGLGSWTRVSDDSTRPPLSPIDGLRRAAYCALLASQYLGGAELLPGRRCLWDSRVSLASEFAAGVGALAFLIKAMVLAALMSWIRVSYGSLSGAGFDRLFRNRMLPLALLQQAVILGAAFLVHLP